MPERDEEEDMDVYTRKDVIERRDQEDHGKARKEIKKEDYKIKTTTENNKAYEKTFR